MRPRNETTSPKRMGRPPSRQREIITDLRGRIISGAIPQAGRLPTREELGQEYEASSVTVQHALNCLVTEGFVVSRGVRGTFVADRPPHLTRYAILIYGRPGARDYTRFWAAMDNEAARLRHSSGLDLQLWHGVEPTEDNEDFHRLVADVKCHRLAGLIFLHPPAPYLHTPLLDEPGIPRVSFAEPAEECPGVQFVYTNQEALIERGLDYLKARGRRRVAMLLRPFLPEAWLREQVKRRRMVMEPYWTQWVYPGVDEATRNCVHLLMNRHQSYRPDGLIIADDNFVEAASAGLVRAGVRIPEDLEVVAHCNFPWPTPSVLPVKRLGFDARHVLRECIDSIDAQRRGERIRAPIVIPPVFEEELSDRGADTAKG